VPEFLIMGVTIGVLPLLAYSFGKGDGTRLWSAMRASAVAVGGIALVFSVVVFAFRDQVFSIFSSDQTLLAIGVTILTAQLVAMIGNGFTGLITSLFQATGRATAVVVMSIAQGILFIPIVILGNLWFGLPGIIWSLTVTELIVLVIGLVTWLASRRAIARGLAEGSEERADQALEQAEV
ncbi:MAG: MATE family efflux transporter, partial [Humibacter sp.]